MIEEEVKAENQVEVPVVKAPENMLSQSEVNKLVGEVRKDARQQGYNKAKAELMAELQQQQVPQVDDQQVRQQPQMGGMSQLTPEQIRQLISEETAKQQQTLRQQHEQESHRQQMGKLAASFIQKMESGKEKYPDFEAQIASLNLPSIPEIVHLAEAVDNTPDVMMDLKNNPHKISNLLTLYARNPALAQASMNQLSASIKQNDVAKNIVMPGDPLQSVQSSQNASVGGTDPSVADLQSFFSKRR